MAGDSHTSEYVSGEMPVERQADTYKGFMSISRYAGTAIILIVFWATIFFGYSAGAVPSALVTLGLGLALSAILKLRPSFTMLMILFCVITGLLSLLFGG